MTLIDWVTTGERKGKNDEQKESQSGKKTTITAWHISG